MRETPLPGDRRSRRRREEALPPDTGSSRRRAGALPPATIDPDAGVDGCQVAKVRPGSSRDTGAGHITIARVFARGGSRTSELPAGHGDDARAGRLPPGKSPAISVQVTTPRVSTPLAAARTFLPRGSARCAPQKWRATADFCRRRRSRAGARRSQGMAPGDVALDGWPLAFYIAAIGSERRANIGLYRLQKGASPRGPGSPSGWHLKSDDLFRRRTRARPFSKLVAPSPRGCHLKRAAEIGARSFRKGACRPLCPSALEGLSRAELRASERPPVSIRAPERSGARLVTLQVSH
jgi:hypothetical protein